VVGEGAPKTTRKKTLPPPASAVPLRGTADVLALPGSAGRTA
jgi:hypothetical protein